MLIKRTSTNSSDPDVGLTLTVSLSGSTVNFIPNTAIEFPDGQEACSLTIQNTDGTCNIVGFSVNPSVTVVPSAGNFPSPVRSKVLDFTFTTESSDETSLTVLVQSPSGGPIYSGDPQVGNEPIPHG